MARLKTLRSFAMTTVFLNLILTLDQYFIQLQKLIESQLPFTDWLLNANPTCIYVDIYRSLPFGILENPLKP